MTRIAVPPPPGAQPPREDPFRYGWRFMQRRQADGTEVFEQVPLTLEDVLHPQEEDCIPEHSIHEQERRYLSDVLHARLDNNPTTLVLSDCLVNWGVEGLRNHSPDISVFFNVRDRERRWGIFPVAEQGARPVAAIEIVSPDTRSNDAVIKVEHYHRAGVPLYVVVDQEKEDGPRRLIGYRDTPDGYVEVPLNERGRLLLEPLGIELGLRDNRLVCYDAATGEEIPDYGGLGQALAAEQAARQGAEEQAELARVRAQTAAQQAMAAQAQAQAAQEQATAARAKAQEAQERAAADRAKAQEAEERAAADRAKASAEAEARAVLEARLRELEAELRRRTGPPADPGPRS